jgi:hypothetical protein
VLSLAASLLAVSLLQFLASRAVGFVATRPAAFVATRPTAFVARPAAQNPYLMIAGSALAFVGTRFMYQALVRSGGGGVKLPLDFVPQPGSSDAGTRQMAKSMYKGGFDDKMTRFEAAKILGVSESADKTKTLERHRAMMKINHPDRGGSPILALKINEAKEIMLKGEGAR